MKDYNKIKLVNGISNAINEAIADIAVTSLENRISAYKAGQITALELIEHIEYVNNINNDVYRSK